MKKLYLVTDGGGREHAAATPHYAARSDPVDTGWPLCHMPRADHADVTLEGQEYESCTAARTTRCTTGATMR